MADKDKNDSNPCMDRWLEDEDELADRLMRRGNGDMEEDDDEGDVETEQVEEEEEEAKKANTNESEGDDWEVVDNEVTKK